MREAGVPPKNLRLIMSLIGVGDRARVTAGYIGATACSDAKLVNSRDWEVVASSGWTSPSRLTR